MLLPEFKGFCFVSFCSVKVGSWISGGNSFIKLNQVSQLMLMILNRSVMKECHPKTAR